MKTKIFSRLLTVLVITSTVGACTKKLPTDIVKIPLGFQKYTEHVVPNENMNLFLFEYHHCPSCDLLRNHLINKKPFQKATQHLNRYHVELGTPLGKKMAKRFEVPVSAIFILADKNFTPISTSPYGLISMTDFQYWLKTQKEAPPKNELSVIQALVEKYPSLKKPRYMGLQSVFSSVKRSPGSIQLKTFAKEAQHLIYNWSRKKFSKSEEFANRYRLGLVYFALAKLVRSENEGKARELFKESLKQYDLLDSGDVKADFGRYIYQADAHMMLGNDQAVAKIVLKGKKEGLPNLSLLYTNIAAGYLIYRDDCNKALEYANQVELKNLPIEGDRVSLASMKGKCFFKNKNLSALEKLQNEVLSLVGPEMQKVQASIFDEIKQNIEILKKK